MASLPTAYQGTAGIDSRIDSALPQKRHPGNDPAETGALRAGPLPSDASVSPSFPLSALERREMVYGDAPCSVSPETRAKEAFRTSVVAERLVE